MSFLYVIGINILGILIQIIPNQPAPLVSQQSSAVVTNSWLGGNGFWDIDANWSLNHVPLESEDVTIPANGIVTIPLGYAAVARTINISFFAQLEVSLLASLSLLENSGGINRITNSGFLMNSGSIYIDSLKVGEAGIESSSFFGTVNNYGLIQITNYEGSNCVGIKNQTSTTFTNHPSGSIVIQHALDVNASSAITNQTNAIFNNQGSILLRDILGGISNVTGGVFENNGSIEIKKCNSGAGISNFTTSVFSNTSSGTILMDSLNSAPAIEGIYNFAEFNNEGSIDIQKASDEGIENLQIGAVLINNGSIILQTTGGTNGILNTNGAILKGSGEFQNDTPVSQDGFLSTGNSPGVMTIQGDLNHTSNSIDTFDVDGFVGGGHVNGHDSIYVSGDLHLEGKIVINTTGITGLYPAAQFVLLEYGGNLTGTFTTTELPSQLAQYVIDINTPGKVILKDPSCTSNANTWMGGTGHWTSDASWSLGHSPTICERVIIQAGDSVTIPAGVFQVQSILLDGGILNVSSSSTRLFINGNLQPNIGIEIALGGRMYNTGLVSISNFNDPAAYGIWIHNGILNNDGNIGISQLTGNTAYGLYVDNNAILTNEVSGSIGVTNIQSHGTRVSSTGVVNNFGILAFSSIAIDGGIFNLGTINNYNSGEITIQDVNSDGVSNFGPELYNEGVITISDCGFRGFLNAINSICTNDSLIDISNTSSSSYVNSSGTWVRGNGKFQFDNFFLQYGKFSPGGSIGAYDVVGDFFHTASSSDTFEIAGLLGGGNANGHDSVHVEGNLALDGEMLVDLLNGFVPNDTDKFILFTYSGSLSGSFSNIVLPPSLTGWFVDYTFPGRVELKKIICDYQVNNWVGGTSIKWNESANWSLGHIPLPCEDVIIDLPDSILIPNGFGAEALSVLVDTNAILNVVSGASLSIDVDYLASHGLTCRAGKVYNSGSIYIQNLFQRRGINNENGAQLQNDGLIEIQSYASYNGGGILNVFQSNFENGPSGQIEISNAGPLTTSSIGNAQSSQFTNQGFILVSNGTPISNITASTFHNFGSIFIDTVTTDGIRNNSDGVFQNYPGGEIFIEQINTGIENNSILINEGTISIDHTDANPILNDGVEAVMENNGFFEITNGNLVFTFQASDLKNENGATLKGSGLINGVQGVRNESFFTPGTSPGIVDISGNFIHASTSSDTFEIAGIGGGGHINGHDSVFVGADLTLAGHLEILLLNSFVPADNDTFTIIEYGGSLTDSFETVTFPVSMADFIIDQSKAGEIRLIKKQCIAGVSEWIGGAGMWNDPSGWSLGHVPTFCETATIGIGDDVTIPPGYNTTVRSVFNNGGQLIISTNAILTIDADSNDIAGYVNTQSGITINHGLIDIFDTNGFNASGLSNSSSGQITNSPTGTIQITNINGSSAEGLINLASFINEGVITIQDVAESIGIFHSISGSTFNNAGMISINTTGGDGLRILASASFMNSGTITIESAGGKAIQAFSDAFLDHSGTIEVRE